MTRLDWFMASIALAYAGGVLGDISDQLDLQFIELAIHAVAAVASWECAKRVAR